MCARQFTVIADLELQVHIFSVNKLPRVNERKDLLLKFDLGKYATSILLTIFIPKK